MMLVALHVTSMRAIINVGREPRELGTGTMKELKNWTKSIEGLGAMDINGVTELYSDMLATAHDLGYKVPDEQLIETEDPEQLKKVIGPLHAGIVEHHAAKVAEEKEKKAAAKADAKKTKAAPAAKKTVAKKPTKKVEQKDVSKETNMATATAKKAPAKKAAKAAPAKKAAKGAGKKAATANARKAAGGGTTRLDDAQVITVKFKDVPGRAGSAVHDRLSNLQKFNGKTVGAFLKSSLGKSSTIHKAKAKGWITLK